MANFNLDAAIADLIWMLSQSNPMVSTNSNRDLRLRLRLHDTDQVAEVLQAAVERGAVEIDTSWKERVIRLTAGRATPLQVPKTVVATPVQLEPTELRPAVKARAAKAAVRPLRQITISLPPADYLALTSAAEARRMSACRLAGEIVETRLAGWGGASIEEHCHAGL